MEEMMNFTCPNCGEVWDVDNEGGLVPSKYPYGHWVDGNVDCCPACSEEKWRWEENNEYI